MLKTDMKSKGIRNALVVGCAVLVTAAMGLGALQLYFVHIFGYGIDPNSSQGLQTLCEIAGASRPLRDALDQYKRDHGSYPASITNLFPAYLKKTTNAPEDFSDFAGWDYRPHESLDQYELRHQVDWDDAFCYECPSNGTRLWTYSTSTGGIDLTGKIGGR